METQQKMSNGVKNSKIRLILTVVVALAIAGGLGYYFYLQFNPPQLARQKEIKEITTLNLENKNDLTPELVEKIKAGFDKEAQILLANPDSVGAYWPLLTIGSIKQQVADYAGAEQAWLLAVKLQPKAYPPYGNLGHLYFRYLQDYPRAEQAYLKAIENSPQQALYYGELYQVYRYFYKNDTSAAEDILIKGLAVNPDSIDLMMELAGYYKDTGEKQKAIEWFDKIIKLDAKNEYAKQMLFELE